MSEYRFEQIQPKILKALNRKEKKGFFGPNADVSLLQGFVNLPFQKEIGGGKTSTVSDKVLLSVVVMDNKTGQLYLFALRNLLPGEDFS